MKAFMYVFPFILISCSFLPNQGRELASEAIHKHDTSSFKIIRPIDSDFIDGSNTTENKTNLDSFSRGLVQTLGQVGSEVGVSRNEVKLAETAALQVRSLKLRRAFLYIQPAKKNGRHNWFSQVMLGKKNTGFDFLKKLEIKVSDFNILKYNRKSNDRDVNENGMIYIAGSENPALTKKILSSHSGMSELIERIVVVDDLLFINLKAEAVEEHFTNILSQDTDLIENSGITTIDSCSKNNCLELDPADINLAPLLEKEGLVLESMVDTSKVPDSLKLKGFIEIEVKIQNEF